MAEYQFEAVSQEHLYQKVEAARELFGNVRVFLQGEFTDYRGDPVFFDHAWKKADQVGSACCEVEVDGLAAFITPARLVSVKIEWEKHEAGCRCVTVERRSTHDVVDTSDCPIHGRS